MTPRPYTVEEVEKLRRDIYWASWDTDRKERKLVAEARLQTHLMIGGEVDAFEAEAEKAKADDAAWEKEYERIMAETYQNLYRKEA